MTPRQFRFVREYLRDNNATQAMVRAGYSPRTANKHMPRLMGHPEVRRLIDGAIADRDSKVRVEATEQLEGMASEARSELVVARENLIDAGRRLKVAMRAVHDIERLCRVPIKRKPAVEPAPEPVERPTATYQPILHWPETTGLAASEYSPLD